MFSHIEETIKFRGRCIEAIAVPPRDPEKLAGTLDRDPERRRRMREAAQRTGERKEAGLAGMAAMPA
jgi:hypothetical protein